MLRKRRKLKKGNLGNYKFCPVCGNNLELSDTFCTRCGYSFANRRRKLASKVKWLNVIGVVIILIAIYLGIRFFNGKPIIPTSFGEILNLSSGG